MQRRSCAVMAIGLIHRRGARPAEWAATSSVPRRRNRGDVVRRRDAGQRRASEIFCSNWPHRSRVVGRVQATLRRATLSVWTASDPSSQSALTPLVKRSSPPPAIRLDEPSRSVRHPRARALASNGRRKSAAERSAGGRSKSKASHDSCIGVAAGWLASVVPQPTSATTNRSLRIRADDTRGPPARRHHRRPGAPVALAADVPKNAPQVRRRLLPSLRVVWTNPPWLSVASGDVSRHYVQSATHRTVRDREALSVTPTTHAPALIIADAPAQARR
jgi:hypothetical protein